LTPALERVSQFTPFNFQKKNKQLLDEIQLDTNVLE